MSFYYLSGPAWLITFCKINQAFYLATLSLLQWAFDGQALVIDFSNKVRKIRKEKGLSPEALAALADIDRRYMGHIERGEKTSHLLKYIKYQRH